jgi:hypothetical protein
MESFTATNSKGDRFDGRSVQKRQCTNVKNPCNGVGHHAVLVSKKSASKREYTVIISKTDIMGSRFGMCTCGYPKKEGIPYNHMVAISKLGRINGLSRIVVMPHWYTTEQWHNQFPEDTFINAHTKHSNQSR